MGIKNSERTRDSTRKKTIQFVHLKSSNFRVGGEPLSDNQFPQRREELQELASLSKGWNSYGAEPPNAYSLSWAERVLDILIGFDFEPYSIVPSAEGGVGIVFTSEGKYADIECFNDGELAAVYYDHKTEPQAWEISPDDPSIKEAINKIRQFLHA